MSRHWMLGVGGKRTSSQAVLLEAEVYFHHHPFSTVCPYNCKRRRTDALGPQDGRGQGRLPIGGEAAGLFPFSAIPENLLIR
jgi:hypothetical protein